jgi:choline-sulfatase
VAQIRAAGYDTALVGKWHIRETPAECGFAHTPLWLPPGGIPPRNPALRRGHEPESRTVQGHITDLFTEAAVAQIGAARRPYFLWLAHTAPHAPWSEDDRYTRHYAAKGEEIAPPAHPKGKPFDWATYYAVITHLDEGVGKVVEAIEKSGEWDNTLIAFLGDNGYLSGYRGLQGKVEPWESSIRVPLIVSGGAVRARGRIDAPTASINLPATFLDYAGVKPAVRLSGQSLRPELESGKSSRETAFSVWNDGRVEALVVRRAVEPYRVARGTRYKLIVWESKRQALYDIQADPGENRDLLADPAHTAALRGLREQLAKRMRDTGDPALAWLDRG